MTGKPRTRTPQQAVALNEVRQTSHAYKLAKLSIEERVRSAIASELNELELDAAKAVRRAYALDVPKAAIGRAMGTTDPHTPNLWLAKTSHSPLINEVVGTFTWIDRDAETVRIDFAGFPTTYTGDDYPEVLSGIVQRVERSKADRNGWKVVLDEGDTQTERGTLPGLLTWEIREVSLTQDGSLTALLNEWVAKQ